MARKLISIPGLPQLPAELTGRDDTTDKFIVDQLRVLWEWKRGIDALAEASSAGGGHTIQEEGTPLTQRTNLNFIGTAVTAADDAGNDATTVTITSGTQNLFETIAVAGQSDIVADSTTDTLTVAAGSNITLTTDPTTDTLTIACTAGQIQGEQGPPGIDGETGPPGPEGPRGADGVFAFTGAVWLTMVGAGGGGATTSAANVGGGGGGSGESVEGLLVKVTPGASYSYAVGAGGSTGNDGGDTNLDVYICKGGKKGAGGVGGQGGGTNGGGGGAIGFPGSNGTIGTAESAHYFGGSGGGGGGSTTAANGGAGGGSGGHYTGASGGTAGGTQAGGGGGGSTIYGAGGGGGNGGSTGTTATSTEYGTGGGGGGGFSTGKAGGTGADGYILITWIGGSAVYTSGSGTWVAPT